MIRRLQGKGETNTRRLPCGGSPPLPAAGGAAASRSMLCVLLVPTPPLLAILLSNALTCSRTCPTRRLLVLPWPSILPLPPCLRFLSPFAASPLPLRSLLSLLPLPEVVSRRRQTESCRHECDRGWSQRRRRRVAAAFELRLTTKRPGAPGGDDNGREGGEGARGGGGCGGGGGIGVSADLGAVVLGRALGGFTHQGGGHQ